TRGGAPAMNAKRLLELFDRLAEAPGAIPPLRRFILDLAVRGKLVEQDPNDEPASALLKRIQDSKKIAANGSRMNPVPPVTGVGVEGPAYGIPNGWLWVTLGQIMVSRDGDRIPVSKDERSRRAKIYDYYGASGVIDKIDEYLFDKPLLLIGEDGANLV